MIPRLDPEAAASRAHLLAAFGPVRLGLTSLSHPLVIADRKGPKDWSEAMQQRSRPGHHHFLESDLYGLVYHLRPPGFRSAAGLESSRDVNVWTLCSRSYCARFWTSLSTL